MSPVLFVRYLLLQWLQNSGKIVNITSLATFIQFHSCHSTILANLHFLRSLVRYKSSMNLNPAFIDVVLGDVKTDFNNKINKKPPE